MKRDFFLILFLITGVGGCGPDLNPQKYLIKSLLISSYEEYTFQYAGDRVQKLAGTDSISLVYTYYRDSTAIKQYNKSGKLTQRMQLVFSGSSLVKSKIKWQFARVWYKDSIQFAYTAGDMTNIVYKGANYFVTTQNGNIISMKRGIGLLSASYSCSYDRISNPMESVYWLDHFIQQNGSTTTLQPQAIVRYFSRNNLVSSTAVILGVTETQRFFYTYLHGILPKTIKYEIENAKSKVTDLVYVFDMQYTSKDFTSSTP